MRGVNIAHPLVIFALSSCSCMDFFVVHLEACIVSDKINKTKLILLVCFLF